VNPGFYEKVEVTRVPPGRPSRTTGGTCTTGGEPLIFPLLFFNTYDLYDVIQYECLQIASLFFLSNCCISFISDNGLRISRNVE